MFKAASSVCKYDGLFVYICTTELKKKNATYNQWKIRMQQRSGFFYKIHANEEACMILFFTQCRLPEMMIFALFSFRGARWRALKLDAECDDDP